METNYIKLNLPNFITISLMALIGGVVISYLLSMGSKVVGKMGGANDYNAGEAGE